MIASGHNSIGAGLAIGAMYIDNFTEITDSNIVLYGFLAILGIILHYVADAIPHGHYKQPLRKIKHHAKDIQLTTFLIGLVDMIASLAVFIYLFVHFFGTPSLSYLAVAITASQLPDMLMLANDTGIASNNPIVKFEQKLHAGPVHWHDSKNGDARKWSWTDVWQIAIFMLGIWICFEYSYYIS